MKTKIGEIILKKNSDLMTTLNERYIAIAAELEQKTKYGPAVDELLNEARENRTQREKYQEEISLMCELENMLQFKKPAPRPKKKVKSA